MTTALAADHRCARPGCRHSEYAHDLTTFVKGKQQRRAACSHVDARGPCTCPEFTPAHQGGSDADA